MADFANRILELLKEIENFPLGECSPSDDPDMQTAYIYSFKDLSKRFIYSLKRIDDQDLRQMIAELNYDIDSITEAYDLKSDLQGIIDYVNDSVSLDNFGLISKFENIREQIKIELSEAKYLIWIAVAWFTDRELANLLYKKLENGLNIQIVLNDDKINSTLLNKLKEHFEVYTIPTNGPYSKLMHHKFCVIDLEKVIHGSYNWTNKAQYNDETISVIYNPGKAKEFAQEFIRLKNKIKK